MSFDSMITLAFAVYEIIKKTETGKTKHKPNKKQTNKQTETTKLIKTIKET